MSGGKPTDALCLCEYDDVEGQRQHLMAVCCDCDALDVACDRYHCSAFWIYDTIQDAVLRCRQKLM